MTILIRCSSLANIMASPTAAAVKAGEVLSVGAKTYLKQLAKEEVYGFHKDISTKPMRKGIECEQEGIELYNHCFFETLTKNQERQSTDLITGEADIIAPNRGVDIKLPWSLSTFPALPEDADSYEWQARGYMHLWDLPRWDIAFCMVDTPDELIGYESEDEHKVSHIDPHLRVTVVTYLRDMEKEALMLDKAAAAQKFVAEEIQRIRDYHA